MKSMTGFGRATADCAEFSLTLDLSSVNKKGFELFVSLPRDWQPMERLISIEIKKSFTRGKINAACRVDFKKGENAFSIDEAALAAAADKLRRACEKLSAPFALTPELLLKLNGEIRTDSSAANDWEDAWPVVEKTLNEALEKIDAMRAEEGNALKADLTMRLQAIFEMVAEVEKNSKDTVCKYRDAMLQRLTNSGLQLDVNDERVLKEISLFADKCDISEEITRLKSHISQFLSTMDENDAVGRKMDFICQEMGREINTIASKANNLELTKLAIELKNELERVREQTQNVE